MEKYCTKCGRVFDDLNYKICPFCGLELATRYGRQPIPRKLRHEVFKRDGYRCRECGASKEETSLEIDHIVPVAKGGTNDIDNLQTLCRECNRMKHTDEWVGGETDSSQIENLIDFKKEEISNLEQELNSISSENEVIECKYKIIKLNEEIDKLSVELEEAKAQEAENLQSHLNGQEREQLYKSIYVSITDEKLNDLKEELKRFNYTTKEQYANYLFDISNSEFDKAMNYIDSEKYYDAISILYNLAENSKSEYIWYLMGKYYHKIPINEIDIYDSLYFFDARFCFKKAIEINPLNIEVKLKLLELDYEEQNKYSVLNLCDEILNIDPKWAEAWILKGKIISDEKYYSVDGLKETIQFFDNALEIEPNNIEPWLCKAKVYNKLFKFSKMLECYDNILSINPKHDETWNNKGKYYGNKLKDYDNALIYFDKAIEINPNVSSYWRNKGLCHEIKKEFNSAINAYNKSLELNPYDDFSKNKLKKLKRFNN